MPRYFFTVESSKLDPDPEGTELPDDHAARIAAVMFLAESLRDEPDLVWDDHRLAVLVDGQDGARLLRVTVAADGPIAEA